MTDTKRLIELAIKGLELERDRIQKEIADLQSQLGRSGSRLAIRSLAVGAVGEDVSNKTASKVRKRRRMSAAARKKLSDTAKRRWIASKKAGKSTP